MTQYRDVTKLLAWLEELEPLAFGMANEVRSRLGDPVETLELHPGVYEMPELPNELKRAWTAHANPDTQGDGHMEWEIHDMGWVPKGEPNFRNGNSLSDYELITIFGPVYTYNPDEEKR